MSVKWKKLVLLSLIASSAQATQFVEHADERHQQVTISALEQNRLAVEGRRIAHVVPSQKGSLSVVKDEAAGALYFALAQDTPGTVTLFVTDDRGVTYKVILVPGSIPGEEIILRPPAQMAAKGNASKAREQTPTYLRAIKAVMLTLADPEGEEVTTLNERIPLWKEVEFTLRGRHTTPDLVGEVYQLTNTSLSTLTVAEPEFYRRRVKAIAVEHHSLVPGASTTVFIVRDRDA